MTTERIQDQVRSFILSSFLAGENPEHLTNTTPLISGGILNSISVIRFVGYLEDTFGFTFSPHEMTEEYLDTIDDITALIQSRVSA